MGIIVRSFGLTIDKVIGATIITADGESHFVDKENEADLFWGIRGGGGQFGVVTEFFFQADKVPAYSDLTTPMVVQTINYSITDLFVFIQQWHRWFRNSLPQLTSSLFLMKGTDGTIIVRARNFWYGAKSVESEVVLKQALVLGPVSETTETLMNYGDFFAPEHTPLEGKNPAYGKNTLVVHIPRKIAIEIQELLSSNFVFGIELRALGGAVNEKSSSFNAWSFREEEIMIAYWVDKAYANEATQLFQPIQQFGSGVYGAYSSDVSDAENARVWSPQTANKLKKIKQKYDPDHLFNQNREL